MSVFSDGWCTKCKYTKEQCTCADLPSRAEVLQASLEQDHRQLKELVGSFIEFIEHRSGRQIKHKISPHLQRRLLDYVQQMKELTE